MSDPSSALPRLLVITDRHATRGRPLAQVVEAALRGGARLVQLREKDLDGGPLLALAEELLKLVRSFDARLLVNDRIDVALAAGADGVVLPSDSFPTEVARSLVGSGKLICRSTHSTEEAYQAAHEGCDFVLYGPVFATPSKADFGPPQGLERLREAARAPIPVYAVGGLEPASARKARDAGAHGIAVIRAVMEADDPAAAVRELLGAL